MKKYLVASLLLFICSLSFAFGPKWLTLPDTPTLPTPDTSGYVDINGAKIWYATYGKGPSVILLHGGLANSNYFGKLIPVLVENHYRAIAIDSRGHGRSSTDNQDFSYSLMASDVLAVMNQLHIQKTAIVGWSDGAITGLYLALHYPDRVSKLFAFGANSTYKAIKEDAIFHPNMIRYGLRAEKEYRALSSTPQDFENLDAKVSDMEATQPNFSKEELASITVPVCIADGKHDECVKPQDVTLLATEIPQAKLELFENTGHFSLIQTPDIFNQAVIRFLND